MHVHVEPAGGPQSSLFDLTVRFAPPHLYLLQVLHGLSEHDLRDIEFVLAQRRAMSGRCGITSGEHTCGQDPGHTEPQEHLCRACTTRWPPGSGQEAAR